MRKRFDEQLEFLNQELIKMGALCEEAIALAATALINADAHSAQELKPLDEEIGRKERDIEAVCMKLLLRQQPVARDLRQISAALKMITDMERIGHQAYDISEIAAFLKGRAGDDCRYISDMARAAINMVTDSIDAFVKQDTILANAVVKRDDEVDSLFFKVKNSLIAMIGSDSAKGEYAIDLLMAAKYFERIADHAVNIAQWVIFSATGVHKEV